MKVLVAIKRVIDYAVPIRVRADKTGVEALTSKMSMNPFCEIAMEEAVRLKERGLASEVLAVSIGPTQCKDTLRTALAMGADRALHVEVSGSDSGILSTPLAPELSGKIKAGASSFSSSAALTEPLVIARALAAITHRERPALWLLGKQAVDDDYNQTAQMLAGLLNCAQISAASKIECPSESEASVFADNASDASTSASRTQGSGSGKGPGDSEDSKAKISALRVTCEVDDGSATMLVQLPAVVSTDLRLNTPRFPPLPAVLKAKKKPVETVSLAKLLQEGGATGGGVAPQLELVEVAPPPPRKRGVMVGDVVELVHRLRNEAKVI